MHDLHAKYARCKLADTSVRISRNSYSNLVKARGMLETLHGGRLTLDDAVYLSGRFTYEVIKLLVKETGDSVTFVSGISGNPETGLFLGPDGGLKYPPELVEKLMDLTKFLLRKHRLEAKEK